MLVLLVATPASGLFTFGTRLAGRRSFGTIVDEGHGVTLVYARTSIELDAFFGVGCGSLSRTRFMRDLVEEAQSGVSEVGRMNAMSIARETG